MSARRRDDDNERKKIEKHLHGQEFLRSRTRMSDKTWQQHNCTAQRHSNTAFNFNLNSGRLPACLYTSVTYYMTIGEGQRTVLHSYRLRQPSQTLAAFEAAVLWRFQNHMWFDDGLSQRAIYIQHRGCTHTCTHKSEESCNWGTYIHTYIHTVLVGDRRGRPSRQSRSQE